LGKTAITRLLHGRGGGTKISQNIVALEKKGVGGWTKIGGPFSLVGKENGSLVTPFKG